MCDRSRSRPRPSRRAEPSSSSSRPPAARGTDGLSFALGCPDGPPDVSLEHEWPQKPVLDTSGVSATVPCSLDLAASAIEERGAQCQEAEIDELATSFRYSGEACERGLSAEESSRLLSLCYTAEKRSEIAKLEVKCARKLAEALRSVARSFEDKPGYNIIACAALHNVVNSPEYKSALQDSLDFLARNQTGRLPDLGF